MAIRNKKTKETAKSNAKSSGKNMISRLLKMSFRSIMPICFILLGGLLFNLDRLGDSGVMLLKYKKILPGFVVKFLPGGSAEDGSAVPDQIIAGQVIEIYDGDTLTLLANDNRKYKVRFFGIDAPEAAQDHGIASRDALRDKILGKEVTVSVVSIDNYGRSVGKVNYGGRYINREMVFEGNAWYYPDYAANEYDLAKAEKTARQKKSGLWSGKSPREPWLYRREKRAK